MKESKERGSGTVLAIGLVTVLLLLAVFMTGLMGVMQAKQGAAKAADLAALIAADTARGLREGDPCQVAAQVAEDNGATLVGCAAPAGRSGTIDVRVSHSVRGAFAFLGEAEAISRAGPPQNG